jgi:hypothetical protein
MGELGPWEYREGMDAWETGRWARTREEADAEVADFMARHPSGSMADTLWGFGGEQPRTCSFCGGIHPDDAIALVRAGWRIDATDKGYKRYMHPPAGQREPSPPVKLYVQHFTSDQIAAFNAALGGPDAHP